MRPIRFTLPRDKLAPRMSDRGPGRMQNFLEGAIFHLSQARYLQPIIDMGAFIEHLKDEHRTILRAVQLLELYRSKILQSFDIDKSDVGTLLFVIRKLVEDVHHKKENVLSQALQMPLEDHESEHFAWMRISFELELYGNKNGREELLARKIQDYIDLIRHHIEKEDTILFAQAERELSRETQVELAAKAREIDLQAGYANTHWIGPLLDKIEFAFLNAHAKDKAANQA